MTPYRQAAAYRVREIERAAHMSKSNLVVLNVLQTTNSGDTGDGNLPSQFIPGAGAGHGMFQIERGLHGYPSHRVLSQALMKWQQDAMLMDYDELTGAGRFVIVDGDSPEPGSVLELHDTITPCEGAALTLTLGAEGIAAFESYGAARSRLRNTSISNMKEWSLRNDDCYRDGAQLAAWVYEAVYGCH